MYNKNRHFSFVLLGAVISVLALPIALEAGSISFDAGLTPPLDRWIVRTQVRYSNRSGDKSPMKREMSMYMLPLVVAYGLRPDLTIMLKQPVISKKMTMVGRENKKTGPGDMFFMIKYRAYRINTPGYTLGVAPTLGVEIPTGHPSLSSRTWDVNSGLFFSWRSGFWASDANIEFKWNGVAGIDDSEEISGNELMLNVALARQFGVGRQGMSSIAPVLELNFSNIQPDNISGREVPNTGESFLLFSPGIKYTTSWYILELLVQHPVIQNHKGFQAKRQTGIIIGSRFLF